MLFRLLQHICVDALVLIFRLLRHGLHHLITLWLPGLGLASHGSSLKSMIVLEVRRLLEALLVALRSIGHEVWRVSVWQGALLRALWGCLRLGHLRIHSHVW